MTLQAKTAVILKALIYEMDEGQPIFYRGYREVLNGTKTIEEVMSDSSLQAWLKGKIYLELSLMLSHVFDITVGEQGLTMGKRKWRATDVAVFRFEDLVLNTKYSNMPPVVAIEIDTKAELENGAGQLIDYYEKKNASLLEFGVQKIIWIFTDNHTVKVVTADQAPQTFDWSEDVPVIEGATLNITGIFKKYNRMNLF